jgi:hypothetical protein
MEARVHAGLMSWESPVSGLPFGRTHNDLDGFSVHRTHHAERDQIARSIRHEADMYDEYISDHEAMGQAYASEANRPSAYDIIVMCNFLTNPSMAEQLRAEVEQLGNSLTPGGVLLILGGVGRHYPAIYKQVQDLLTKRLLPVMDEEMEANDEPWARSLIACQQREAVEFLRQACHKGSWNKVQHRLPRDLLDSQLPFSLPRFRALLFKRETRTQAMTLSTRESSKRASGDVPTQGRI